MQKGKWLNLGPACDLDASLLLSGRPSKESFLAGISYFNYFDGTLV